MDNYYLFEPNASQNLNQTESLSKKVVQGGVWVFALRMANRGLRFIRTVILARLLAPEDFGLLGIAMLSIATLETFSETGFRAALIQKREDIESHLDTAWTVSVIRGLILFILLFLSAPLIAEFFSSPQATLVIRVVSLSTQLMCFKNVGMIYFHKDLDFKRPFYYEFSAVLVSLSVSIGLAILFRNVWVLVIGGLAANIFRLAMSYVIHPYRPWMRIDKSQVQDMFRFGKWIFFSSIVFFLCSTGDQIFVGRLLGVAALGFYQMAFGFSNLATTEITHMISRVTFPAYSKLQNDLPRLREAFLRVLKFSAFFAFPISGGILILSSEFTHIFLGEKWLAIIPILNILVIANAFSSIVATVSPVFQGVGKPKIDTFWQVIRLIVLASLIFPVTALWGIKGPAVAVLCSTIAPTLGLMIAVTRTTKCNPPRLLKALALPGLNTFIMVFFLILIKDLYSSIGLADFFVIVMLGVFIYSLVAIVFDYYLNFGLGRILRENLKISIDFRKNTL
jgi:lipopolysaccharide exporter